MGSHLSRCTLWASSSELNSWRLSDQRRDWKRLDLFVTTHAFGFGRSILANDDNMRACGLRPARLLRRRANERSGTLYRMNEIMAARCQRVAHVEKDALLKFS